MSKFEGMSDFEINKLVAQARGLKVAAEDTPAVGGSGAAVCVYDHFKVDYCNSWADMGPIVKKHNISISPMLVMTSPVGAYEYTGEWSADIYSVDDVSLDRNPLRAAAIIYLESLEQNNA